MRSFFLAIFLIILIVSKAFAENTSSKVFAPFDSQVFHSKECKQLPSNIQLIEFPSVQKAIDKGAVPCKLCISQAITSFIQQSSKSTLGIQGNNRSTTNNTESTKVTIPSFHGEAYKTKIALEHNGMIKLDNGAIVEINFGNLEFAGYGQTAIIFNVGKSWKIWIEGKKDYKCEVLKTPDSVFPSTAKIVMISEVKGNGTILKMSDGSIYEVDSINTTLWLGTSNALIINDHELINLDKGDEIIEVTKLR
jgi:hypothetical protein